MYWILFAAIIIQVCHYRLSYRIQKTLSVAEDVGKKYPNSLLKGM